MKTVNKLALVLGLMLSASFAHANNAAEPICKVFDPTTTPLNVRDAPFGKRIGTLANTTQVKVEALEADRQGRAWALVKWQGQPLAKAVKIHNPTTLDQSKVTQKGWVIREYLTCVI